MKDNLTREFRNDNMDDQLIEDLKKFRNDNYNSFFDMGVVETRMYINASNYVSFEFKVSSRARNVNPDYQKRFNEARDNFKNLYDYTDFKHFSDYRDGYDIQEYRYLNIFKRL